MSVLPAKGSQIIENQRKRGDARFLSDFALGSVWVWNQVSDTKHFLRRPRRYSSKLSTLVFSAKEPLTSLGVVGETKSHFIFWSNFLEHNASWPGWKGARHSYVTVPLWVRGSCLCIVGFTVSLLNLITETIQFTFYYCYLQSWKSTRET